jgi:hypothetical protein
MPREEIKIAHFDTDLAGEKVEPEEQPAQRESALPVTFNFARPDYEGLGAPIPTSEKFTPPNYPSTAVRETTAGEVANKLRRCCMNCTSFRAEDKDLIKRMRDAENGSKTKREIRELKAVMIKLGVARGKTPRELDANAEIALRSLRICTTWTEIKGAQGAKGIGELVHPLATCEHFRDRAEASASAGSRPDSASKHAVSQYDKALSIAQGRK